MFLYAVTYDYCKAHTSMTVVHCLPMRVGSNLILSLSVVRILKGLLHLYNSLSTFCVYDSFELLSFGLMNHVDTSQLERLWRGELS